MEAVPPTSQSPPQMNGPRKSLDLFFTGDYDKARTQLDDAVTQLRNLNSRVELADALLRYAFVTGRLGQTDCAHEALQECLQLSRAIRYANGVAMALNYLGFHAGLRGEYEEAEALLADSLAAANHSREYRTIASTLNTLGYVLHCKGDQPQAQRLLERSLTTRPMACWARYASWSKSPRRSQVPSGWFWR